MTRHIHVLLPTRRNVSAWVAAKLEDSHRRRTERANARAGLDWFPVAPPTPVDDYTTRHGCFGNYGCTLPRVHQGPCSPTDFDG